MAMAKIKQAAKKNFVSTAGCPTVLTTAPPTDQTRHQHQQEMLGKKEQTRSRVMKQASTSSAMGDTESTSATDNTDFSAHSTGATDFTSEEMSSSMHLSIDSERNSSIRLSNRESARNENVEKLTANKLRFSSLGLHGRDKESDILKQCLERLVLVGRENTDAKSRELVFISGVSGTGKTSLASTMARTVKHHKGLYLTGKFDLYLRDEPYSGIAAACRELCGEILMLQNDNEKTYQEIRCEIISELGEEISLLTNLIPVLEEIVGHQDPSSLIAQGNIFEAKESFNFAFRKFMRLVGTRFSPLVITLDDLQWADAASLELVETLITDRSNPHLMIIGCYRSNEVDDAHFLSKTIRDLHGRKEKDCFQITDIHIGNLSVSDVNHIIMELLSIDSEALTLGLAEICHIRTLGNAFHLVAYMSMLQEEGLLEFNLGLFQWKWDAAKIEEETAASSNVVDLMKEKMKKQPEAVSNLLQLASCLGSSFDEKTLLLVWEALRRTESAGKTTPTEDGLLELLSQAVDEAFIEALAMSRYRWVHDKVQEAAMGLVAKENLPYFKFQVGQILLRELSQTELEAAVFVVANLLKNEEVMDSDKRAKIAEVNLKAAEKAVEYSAFESAAKYGEKGIRLLSPDRWTSQRELSLQLYSICTEVHGCLGNLDEMQKHCDEVLNQKQLPLSDKLRVYVCLIQSIGNGGNSEEALGLLLDVLGQLGCTFPRTSVLQIVKAIAWLGKTKFPTKEVVAALPLMTDPTKKSCMMLMDNLATYAHYSGNTFVFILAATRMVRWTIRYGLSEYSPSAFALLGIVKIAGGEYQAAGDFAGHALLLLDKLKSKKPESRTLYLSWFLLFPWTKPLPSTLKYLLQGYKVGMETGDTESAMWNVSMYILSSYIAGKSLNALDMDCRTYLLQMQELQQEDIFTNTTPFWQVRSGR